MAHARDYSPSDDRYEKSLLEELEDVAPPAPVDPSAALLPKEGEGVAEVLAHLDIEQNPPRDTRSETPSGIIKGLIHKATRKHSKSLDSNAARSTEPITETRSDPSQLGACPKVRQTRQL